MYVCPLLQQLQGYQVTLFQGVRVNEEELGLGLGIRSQDDVNKVTEEDLCPAT